MQLPARDRDVDALGTRPAVAGQTPSSRSGRDALWDAASGRFHPIRLRTGIVARGWTVPDFARAAGIARATVYRAVRGTAVSDRTVLRVIAALDQRSPSGLIDG